MEDIARQSPDDFPASVSHAPELFALKPPLEISKRTSCSKQIREVSRLSFLGQGCEAGLGQLKSDGNRLGRSGKFWQRSGAASLRRHGPLGHSVCAASATERHRRL